MVQFICLEGDLMHYEPVAEARHEMCSKIRRDSGQGHARLYDCLVLSHCLAAVRANSGSIEAIKPIRLGIDRNEMTK